MTTRDVARQRYFLRGGETWRNPWEDYRWLRDHDPVHCAVDPDFGPYVVLSRFEHVLDAVRDTATFSSARGLTLDPKVMDLFESRATPIVMMDPPDHTAMRRLVAKPTRRRLGRRLALVGLCAILGHSGRAAVRGAPAIRIGSVRDRWSGIS